MRTTESGSATNSSVCVRECMCVCVSTRKPQWTEAAVSVDDATRSALFWLCCSPQVLATEDTLGQVEKTISTLLVEAADEVQQETIVVLKDSANSDTSDERRETRSPFIALRIGCNAEFCPFSCLRCTTCSVELSRLETICTLILPSGWAKLLCWFTSGGWLHGTGLSAECTMLQDSNWRTHKGITYSCLLPRARLCHTLLHKQVLPLRLP
jgi:hypothetical protein